MAVSLTGTGNTLDQSLNTILADFRVLNDDKGVVKNSARQYKLKPHSGNTFNVLNYGRVQGAQLQDGVDMSQAQALQDALTSLSPVEAGVQIILSGRTITRAADGNIQGNAAEVASNAYDLLEDQLGIVALASFTGSATLGSAGTVNSPGIQAAGFARLRVGDNRTNPEPAPTPWYSIIHPYAALPLWGRMIPLATTPAGSTAYGVNTGAHAGVSVATGDTAMGDDLLKKGIGAIGMVAGGMVKQDANFLPDANDDFTGAVFSEEGLIYLSEQEGTMDAQRDDASMRGAVELNFWGSYGFTVYRPANYGVPETLDASTPTS